MAATNYTPIQLYHSTTTTAVPVNTNLVDGELAINITDGKLFYKDNSGTVQVIATKATGTIGGSTTQVQYNNSGALAGSANFTFNGTTATINTLNLTNALGAAYGGTAQTTYTAGDIIYATGATALAKLGIGLSTYILTSTGSAPQWSAPTAISVSTATNLAGGAAGSVPYQSGAGATTFLAIGTANRVLTSSGTAPQWSTALTGLTSVSSNFDTLGGSGFTLPAVLSATAPAKLYINTSTVTDGSSAIGATNALGAITSFDATTVAATNANVTYTNLATLVINAVPVAGTNVTITNPYALYVAAGASYFASTVTVNGTVNATTVDLTTLEVTNIKAKDGTAAIVLTDSTGAVTISTALTANGGAVFNENGANVDFRVEGDNEANLLFVDASADAVGIGTSSPAAKFQTQQTSAGSRVTGALLQNVGATASTAVSLDFAPHENTTTPEVLARINAIRTNQSNAPTDLVFSVFNVTLQERARITSTGTLNIVGAGTAGSTQAISFNGSTPVDTLVTDSSGRVGIGTSSPVSALGFGGAASATGITFQSTSTTFNSGKAAVIYASIPGSGNGSLIVETYEGGSGGGERMRVSSNGTFRVKGAGTAGSTDAVQFSGSAPASSLLLDASGNLGLGVTPSAWEATRKFMQFPALTYGGSAFGTDGGDATVVGNAFSDGSWKYITSSIPASLLSMRSGLFKFFIDANAASPGAAGTAVSFTQAMTLDASGNLGIVTTSPSSFDAAARTLVVGTTSGNNGITIAAGSTGASTINFADGTTGGAQYAGYIDYQHNGDYMRFGTNGGTERARITSGGDFRVKGAGTAGSTDAFQVSGSAPADAARLDSNGYFDVDCTATPDGTTRRGFQVVANTGVNDTTKILIATTTTSTRALAEFNNGNGNVGSISVTGSATAYNTSSDYRLKDNPQPLTGSGAFIDALKPKTWNWKSDGSKGVGFIAHEVQEVSPGTVVGAKDAVDADGKPVMQAMEYGSAEFIANIVAELQSLRARVAQLESKGA